jgi:pantetheine-phosphate adenylyltransferase
MIREAVGDIPNVTVDSSSGLLVDYAKKRGAGVIVKGLRAVSDFDYEFKMALMNKKLSPELETFFMMTSLKYLYLSSSLVKEVASYGGCIKDLVPPTVEDEIVR